MTNRPVCECHGEFMTPTGLGGKRFICRIKNKENSKKWRLENPKRYKELKALSYERHKEAVKAGVRKYRLDNPEWAREKSYRDVARRRALKRGAVIGPSWTREQLIERDGAVCYLCTKPIDLTLTGRHSQSFSEDHVIPLSRGGAHAYENVKPAHFGCNAAKGNRITAA